MKSSTENLLIEIAALSTMAYIKHKILPAVAWERPNLLKDGKTDSKEGGELRIRLRELEDSDLDLTRAWRSNPLVYEGFYSQHHPLTGNEHLAWYESRNKDWRNFIVLYDNDEIVLRVGVVTIGQLDHWCPEIGFYIGEVSLWGKGIGKEAVRLGLEWIKDYGREYVHTTVPDTNERAIRLLKSLGFEYLGKARVGESWYQKKL